MKEPLLHQKIYCIYYRSWLLYIGNSDVLEILSKSLSEFFVEVPLLPIMRSESHLLEIRSLLFGGRPVSEEGLIIFASFPCDTSHYRAVFFSRRAGIAFRDDRRESLVAASRRVAFAAVEHCVLHVALVRSECVFQASDLEIGVSARCEIFNRIHDFLLRKKGK